MLSNLTQLTPHLPVRPHRCLQEVSDALDCHTQALALLTTALYPASSAARGAVGKGRRQKQQNGGDRDLALLSARTALPTRAVQRRWRYAAAEGAALIPLLQDIRQAATLLCQVGPYAFSFGSALWAPASPY